MRRSGRLETPFILAYYETMNMAGVEEPLRTQPTRERFALVEPTIEPGTYLLDIHFRML